MKLSSLRQGSWQWWVSILLLLATMINYMDRQTLANLSVRIKTHFELNQEQYGNLETCFGVAFAFGALFFGALADRISVRLLYPAVLLSWSAIGFLTGLVSSYNELLICRTLLGFFEAGHWPCALIVTHAVLTQSERALGNSILQSGASIGAIVTPLIIRVLAGDKSDPNGWRPPFIIIGIVGIVWVALWLWIVRPNSIAPPKRPDANRDSSQTHWLVEFFTNPKFWALFIMVTAINASWQLVRAWLPMFLQTGRGYSEEHALYINSAYFIATDVGCLMAGAGALWLVKRGWNVHRSRLTIYAVCSLLSTLTLVASVLPRGPLLIAVMLTVGAGLLGLFPCYYSFTQELSANGVGKATGLLSFLGWLIPSPLQRAFGQYVDKTGSFDFGIAVIGLMPLLGLFAMLVLWRNDDTHSVTES